MRQSIIGETITSEEVRRITLEMLLYVDSVCRHNNIKYSLTFGTLLGAIRHHGFIPWDDDVDVCVPITEYEKLMVILKKENKYMIRYDCFEEKYYYWHAKLVNPNTIAIETNKPFDENMGIWIDIFPVCGVSEIKPHETLLNELNLVNQRVFSSINWNYMFTGSLVKTIVKAVWKLPFGISCKIKGTKYWKNLRRSLYLEQPMESARLVGIVPTPYGEKSIYPKQMFEGYTNVSFEGYKLMCIEKWDDFLTHTYGDYMTPPAIDKRLPSHFKAYYKKK